MSLIRGFGGLFPCPICFVRHDELLDLAPEDGYQRRTASHSKEVLRVANEMVRAGDKEDILKEHGLRPVEVQPIRKTLSHAFSMCRKIPKIMKIHKKEKNPQSLHITLASLNSCFSMLMVYHRVSIEVKECAAELHTAWVGS